jgi:copper(I)-binding protein
MSHFVLAPLKRRAALALLGLAVGFGPLFLSSAIAHDFKQGSLTIDHPTVTPTRGIVPVNAGYMTILNAGTNADRLISATSPDAGRIKLHEHRRGPDGMMQMREVQGGIAVPAKGQVRFAQGGLHLMIFDPKQPLKEGDYFPITLTFERAGRVNVVAMVEAPTPQSKRHAH